MELLEIKDLSFTYPDRDVPALRSLALRLPRGSFTLLCGASGCGKTTLLRLLKPETAPRGTLQGAILYDGRPLDTLDARESAARIGFVGQFPDEQLVTDKVWHELAFGLENLGLPNADIRRRVGEMASYFGIQDWYHRETDRLSGGQKQLLNLASVMVMNPSLLLLDEPTAQLDPIAAADFIATLRRLNRELGVTVLLSEHRLEEVFPIADRVVFLQDGCIAQCLPPRALCGALRTHSFAQALPAAARIWSALQTDAPCPMSVREGREFLQSHFSDRAGALVAEQAAQTGEAVLEAKDIGFRYEKDAPDVLRGLSLTLYGGEVFALLGANGSGKTTLLNVLAGLERPYQGTLRIFGKKQKGGRALYHHGLTLLPQDLKCLFLQDSVREDYRQLLAAMQEPEARLTEVAQRLHIEHLLDRHPYDLSGGEQQKCALGKLLLTRPRLMLMDEPTKGMDAAYKQEFLSLLRQLRREGCTVALVTHDVEFAAEAADRCALFFDGEIIAHGTPNAFFSGNYFYTTAASRIARSFFPNAVLCREVAALCGGEAR